VVDKSYYVPTQKNQINRRKVHAKTKNKKKQRVISTGSGYGA